jgi:CrcB protein
MGGASKGETMNPPSFLAASLYVAIGGGMGSWLRFLVGRLWTTVIGPIAATAFPWSTLTVNLLGSFAMGLLAGWLARHGTGGEGWRLLLGVGVLGGFTTFSAFSLDFAVLVERGAIGTAAAYVGVSLLAGFVGLFAGLAITRSLA